MQGGSEWDGHCFEIRQASVFEGKGNNLMVIMLFGERHRKRAAGIAYRLASPYPLRLVDVTEGRIGKSSLKASTDIDSSPPMMVRSLRSSSDSSAPVACKCPIANRASPVAFGCRHSHRAGDTFG